MKAKSFAWLLLALTLIWGGVAARVEAKPASLVIAAQLEADCLDGDCCPPSSDPQCRNCLICGFAVAPGPGWMPAILPAVAPVALPGQFVLSPSFGPDPPPPRA